MITTPIFNTIAAMNIARATATTMTHMNIAARNARYNSIRQNRSRHLHNATIKLKQNYTHKHINNTEMPDFFKLIYYPKDGCYTDKTAATKYINISYVTSIYETKKHWFLRHNEYTYEITKECYDDFINTYINCSEEKE